MGLHQTEKFLHSKGETINTMKKRQLTELKKIFTYDTFDKGVILKIYKEFIQLNTKKNPKQSS